MVGREKRFLLLWITDPVCAAGAGARAPGEATGEAPGATGGEAERSFRVLAEFRVFWPDGSKEEGVRRWQPERARRGRSC